jgi:hypothetical protein
MGTAAPTADTDSYGRVEFWRSPEHAGWLTKQGEYIKTWQRWWFMLKQGKLFWFKDSVITHAFVTRGLIPIASSLTVKAPRTCSTGRMPSSSPPRRRPCISSLTLRSRSRRRRRSGSTPSAAQSSSILAPSPTKRSSTTTAAFLPATSDQYTSVDW